VIVDLILSPTTCHFVNISQKSPPPPTFRGGGIKQILSPTTCHYQIFDENINPVDMHTSIMCINIIQNIKAVHDLYGSYYSF
jgi:hypothetical protein